MIIKISENSNIIWIIKEFKLTLCKYADKISNWIFNRYKFSSFSKLKFFKRKVILCFILNKKISKFLRICSRETLEKYWNLSKNKGKNLKKKLLLRKKFHFVLNKFSREKDFWKFGKLIYWKLIASLYYLLIKYLN